MPWDKRWLQVGLSPRVRGNPHCPTPCSRAAGSIPACAGEPRRRRLTMASIGLSPRVRGNRRPGQAQFGRQGSIPACAGEPLSIAIWAAAAAVYPRVCGGTPAAGLCGDSVGGLSPRVRGNHWSPGLAKPPMRSIPACAGEPGGDEVGDVQKWVYPRVCGGTFADDLLVARRAGLSPRVRGNLRIALRIPPPERSIPACAGEPYTFPPCKWQCWVYPRVCGGTYSLPSAFSWPRGLSPRVRGNLDPQPGDEVSQGSIPACAGEPTGMVPAPVQVRVYPRVCGGTDFLAVCGALKEGLSPRVRGNLCRAPSMRTSLRSIPACAGEPAGFVCVGTAV